MLNLRDLRIDPASLGRKMLLVDVMPAYEYKDGKRTETVSGYRYVVCLAEHRLEKLSVRIDGPQQMEKPEGFVDVEFTDLVVTGYARFHDLRHSFAVSSLYAGDDIKTVQANLGHATAQFTLDVYGHVTQKMRQDSANRMQKFYEQLSSENAQ